LNEEILIIIGLSFAFSYIDIIAGMGFGTLSIPILLLMGYSPIEAIPTILLVEITTGLLSAFLHQKFKNINLKRKKTRRSLTIFAGLGATGTVLGVIFANILRQDILTIVIGVLVTAAGIAIIVRRKAKRKKMGETRIVGLGLTASITKAMTGIYGPIITTGQILSGVRERYSVSLAKISEGLISIFALIAYMVINDITFIKPGAFILGAAASVPLATYSVRKIPEKYLKYGISIVSIGLGAFVVINTL